MNCLKISISFLLTIFTLLFYSCQRDTEIEPLSPTTFHCDDLYSVISADTNYIPHKKNNFWKYCSTAGEFSSSLFIDTIKNGKIYFEYVDNYGYTSHNPLGCICGFNKMFIDSMGNYFTLRNDYTYLMDTLKIIDLKASNGDTIFKSKISPHYILLINKNDVFESITNCYHIKISFPEYNRSEEYYYKKGLGIVNNKGSKLIDAKIN